MAYREKTFNADTLTDLLSTYLSHKNMEREKYYQAELKRKPTYKSFGDQMLKIGPDGQSIETVMTKKPDPKIFEVGDKLISVDKKTGDTKTIYGGGDAGSKQPKTKEFKLPDGMAMQGMWMGLAYEQTEEDKANNMEPGYKFISKYSRFKAEPEGKTSEAYDAVNKTVSDHIKRLNKIKYGSVDEFNFRSEIKWEDDPDLANELEYYKKIKRDIPKWIANNPAGAQPVYRKTEEKEEAGEGKIIINQSTGERLILRDGKWQPIK